MDESDIIYNAALKLIILDKNYDYANICINMCGRYVLCELR